MSKKIYGFSKRNWKCFFAGFVLAWVCAGGCCAAFAGVPVKFTVETSRADVQEVQCYHGETLDFDVTFKNYGRDLYFQTNAEAQIFWQTNGMSAFYWRTNNVNVISNRMTATFLPEMDPGANTVFGFIGIPGEIYRASFVLRLKQSPGVKVKEMEWPYRELDFAKVEMKNVPFYFKDELDEVLIDTVKNATNKLYEVLHREVETATPGNYEIVSNRAMTALQSFTETDPTAKNKAKEAISEELDRALSVEGKIAEAKATGDALAAKRDKTDRQWGERTFSAWTQHTTDFPDSAIRFFATVEELVESTWGNEYEWQGVGWYVNLGVGPGIRGWGPSDALIVGSGDAYFSRAETTDHLALESETDEALKGKADEFTEWVCTPSISPCYIKWFEDDSMWWIAAADGSKNGAPFDETDKDATELSHGRSWTGDYDFTATRKRVLRTGDAATTNDIAIAIAANKPEYKDIPSNVVWRIEAEGGRFFFKPVRPINMED